MYSDVEDVGLLEFLVEKFNVGGKIFKLQIMEFYV